MSTGPMPASKSPSFVRRRWWLVLFLVLVAGGASYYAWRNGNGATDTVQYLTATVARG